MSEFYVFFFSLFFLLSIFVRFVKTSQSALRCCCNLTVGGQCARRANFTPFPCCVVYRSMCHLECIQKKSFISLHRLQFCCWLIHKFSSSQKHCRAVALALFLSVPCVCVCVCRAVLCACASASALIAIYVPWITKSYQFFFTHFFFLYLFLFHHIRVESSSWEFSIFLLFFVVSSEILRSVFILCVSVCECAWRQYIVQATASNKCNSNVRKYK